MSFGELNKRLKFIKTKPVLQHKMLLEHINDLRFWAFTKQLKT